MQPKVSKKGDKSWSNYTLEDQHCLSALDKKQSNENSYRNKNEIVRISLDMYYRYKKRNPFGVTILSLKKTETDVRTN